jgi:hypothetical protein
VPVRLAACLRSERADGVRSRDGAFESGSMRQRQAVGGIRCVRIVLRGETDGQLEAAGLDKPAQRLDARFDRSAFPAGDLRLCSSDAATELGRLSPARRRASRRSAPLIRLTE